MSKPKSTGVKAASATSRTAAENALSQAKKIQKETSTTAAAASKVLRTDIRYTKVCGWFSTCTDTF